MSAILKYFPAFLFTVKRGILRTIRLTPSPIGQ